MNVNRKLNVMLAMQVYARVVETGTFTRWPPDHATVRLRPD